MNVKSLVIYCVLLVNNFVKCTPIDREAQREETVKETSEDNYNFVNFDKDFTESDKERGKVNIPNEEENGVKDYYSKNDISIYDLIRDENVAILTKIERLYNAFKSQIHQHENQYQFPLLTIVETDPHSMTIMVKPEEFKPDTMVKYIEF